MLLLREGTNGTLVSPEANTCSPLTRSSSAGFIHWKEGDLQTLSADLENDDDLIDWERDGRNRLIGKTGIPVKVVRVYLLNSSRRADDGRFRPLILRVL